MVAHSRIICLVLLISCFIFTNQVLAHKADEQTLIEQLLSLDNNVRLQAENRLIELGSKIIPTLSDTLTQLEPEYDILRRNVVRILGKIGSPQALPALLTAVNTDPNPLVKATAINSMEKIAEPEPEILQTLEKALLDPNSEVRIAAADLLRKFGKQANTSKISLLLLTGAADSQVAWAAQRALLAIAPSTLQLQPDILDQVIARLANPNWQQLAITVLARNQATSFQPLLDLAIDSRINPMYRVPALQAIQMMNRSNTSEFAVLEELLFDPSQPFLIRTKIAEILNQDEQNPLREASFQNKIPIQVENLDNIDYNITEVTAIIGLPQEAKIADVSNLTVWNEAGQQVPALFTPISYWDNAENLVKVASVSFYPALTAYERSVYFVNLKPGTVLQPAANKPFKTAQTKVSIAQANFLLITDVIHQPQSTWVTQLIVSADGSGHYTTVQAAIDAIPENNNDRVLLYIKPGTYHEKILIPSNKPFISLIGENVETTMLTFNETAQGIQFSPDELYVTWGAASTIVAGNDFTAENITFHNSSLRGTGQAQAIRIDADRAIFYNCKFISHQDTVFANGDSRQYFLNCYIEGDVDFIYGSATAVFENCDIINNRQTGGYITAASTPAERQFGFVFINCNILGDVNRGSVWLGRPWRDYAHTAFINCYLSEVVQPAGWHNWGSTAKEKTARYEEYNSYGPGANPQGRVPWSRQLTFEEASLYTTENILKGTDNWLPQIRTF